MKRAPALALALALAAALALPGCKRREKVSPDALELTQRYAVRTRLAVLRYPKSLAPSQVNEWVATLRPVGTSGPFDGDDELYVSTNQATATNILEEYVRILHQPLETDMEGWTETSRQATSCLGVYPGIELRAIFAGKDKKRRRYWSCTFLRAPHGYKVSYVVTESAAATDEPLLRKVVDATEVTP